MAQRKFTLHVLSYLASISGSLLVMFASKLAYRKNKITDVLAFIGRNSMTVLVIHFIDSNMIPWEVILKGNPSEKKYIITWFILRMVFIAIVLTVWVWLKGRIGSGKKDKLSI